jgi:type I restriction enzyme R subunit
MARLSKLVMDFSAAFALAVPRPETEEIAPHLAFFQRLVAMLQKRLAEATGDGERFRRCDVDAAVRHVIGGAMDASQVIDLFAAAGLNLCGLTT